MRLSVVLKMVMPAVVLAAILAVSFHRLLESPRSLIVDGRRPNVDHAQRGRAREVGNDLTSVFLPRFLYVVAQVRATGKPPTWDALGFGGRPLVGNPQAGSYYPPVWLAWRSGDPSALGWLTLAHLLWAGLGVYALSRAIGFGPQAAVLAGACFEVSPYLIAHTFEGHYPHVWAACWYPWAFWAFLLKNRKNALGDWFLPPILALTFLTGHPQEWYYLVVVLSVWVGFDAFREGRAGGLRAGLRPVSRWGAAIGLSLALCAVDLIPQVMAGGWSLKNTALPLTQMNRYRLHSFNLIQLLSPFALGGPRDYFGDDNYWETVFSIGLAPLVLAVLGVARRGDRIALRPWLVLIGATVVFAGGKQLGLYSMAYALLPGMDRFRVPARTLFLASLGTSVLAGAGADALWRQGFAVADWERIRGRLRGTLIGATAFMILLSGVAAWSNRSELQAVRAVAGSPGFWLGLLGMLAVVLSSSRGGRGQSVAAWGLASVAALELTFYAQTLLVCAPVAAFLGDDPIGRAVRLAEGDGAQPVRLASFGSIYPDARAAALGLEKTNVNDGFQIQHAADVYKNLYPLLDSARPRRPGQWPMDEVVEERTGEISQAVCDLMGVRYLVTDRPLPLPRFEAIATTGTADEPILLYRNRTALPRAYVVPRAVSARRSTRTIRPKLVGFDPRTAVVLARDPLPNPQGDRQPFTAATWSATDPDEFVVHVRTEAPGLLVIGNTWMPGWLATVDARASTVERGNHWQQVIALPRPGRHEIVLRYSPPGLAAGSALAGSTLALWSGLGMVLAFRWLKAPGWVWRPSPSASPVFTS